MKSANSPRMPAAGRPRSTPGSGRSASRRRTAATAKGPRRGGRAHVRVARAPRPGRFAPPDPARIDAILGILERTYPDATTALDFQTPLQLLIATILSAQCTDVRVNMVTPALFARYPDAAAFAAAPQADLEAMIRSTGFYRNKAHAIRECCADIVAKHHGEVPRTLEELIALRGVGRKTANVVLGNAFGMPGLVVDTHVGRLSAQARPVAREGPGQDRVRAHAVRPARAVDAVLALADPPRTQYVHRAQAALLDLPARSRTARASASRRPHEPGPRASRGRRGVGARRIACVAPSSRRPIRSVRSRASAYADGPTALRFNPAG